MRAMQIPGHIDPVAVPRGEIARADGRVDVVGLTRAELREALIAAGIAEKQAKMRAQQIWHWIYNRGATDFSAMTSISKETQAQLAERFVIGRPEVVEAQVSTDGTRKWLLRSADRSEEHTSELQSLMRISYAVFCLKKKIKSPYKNNIRLRSTYNRL